MKIRLQKIKTLLLLALFSLSSFNIYTQTSSLISTCGDFDAGPTAWPYVLVATTIADGASSQGAQTFTMNVTDTVSGANFRVVKTTANGNFFFGPAIALTIGSNSITVPAVTFDRTVKFQFSSGDVEFDFLSLNGDTSDCIAPPPPSSSSLISTCGDFDAGPTSWPYVLVATTIADGASSQGAQTFTMNVTDTASGANFRVVKTTANGNFFFGPAIALTIGSNSITVPAVTFDRTVKFQFSSGDVEFDFLSLNGDTSDCIAPPPPSSSSLISTCGDFDAGPTSWPYVLVATTVADGASSQGAQTFTMNVTDTASGANFRVVKTTANGNFFFGPAIALTIGSNSITVPAVTFDRTVKFQFSSGDVEFDFLSLNGDTSDCIAISGCTDSTAYNYNLNANISDSSCIYCYSPVTDTFLFTGGVQSFIVPNGVDSINVYLSGAQGSLGGLGGSIQADLSVSNDSIIYIYVGGQGLTQYGGWNGGGSSGSVAPGGGGGGASDIRIGGNSLSNRVIVAGGGGGRGITGSGATTGYGGAGGQTSYNLSAGNGTYYAYGTGASVTSPGVGGLYFPWGSGNNGGLGYGGSYCSTCFNMGGGQGGGGSGYYGGGAGGANSGGGGGSNMANSSLTSNILTFQGNNTGHGKIIISYSNTYTNTVMATSCDSYDWDGVTYDSTGIYTNTYTGYNGCDSTVFLDLTINNSSSSNSIISACGSYIFNGLILTSSGIYTDTLLGINSCDSIVTIDLSFGVYGCTDSLAWNFDSLATCDDGSCLYSYMCNNPYPNALFADNIIDVRATIHWNNMNTDSCRVWKNFIRYKKVTDNTWTTKAAGVGSGLCNVGLPTQQKILQNLTPNTTYEYKMKSFYCGGMESGYSPAQQFTTAGDCPEMTNLSVQTFGGNHYKARFSWDTTGTYVFARIALRIDTTGANWQTAGGFGIYYPSLSVNKFGLQSGQSYRAQGRTFCDSNITIYRSWWTSPIFWTQPGSTRLNGGVIIKNLNIYPNPTNNIFNVSFVSDEIQSLSVRVLNIIGEVFYQESLDRFIGEYTKQISLENYSKGIYILEIMDNQGTINKKIILQ